MLPLGLLRSGTFSAATAIGLTVTVPVVGWIRSVGVRFVSGYVCAPVSGAET